MKIQSFYIKMSTSLLTSWIIKQRRECPDPRQRLAETISELEKIAYTKGLREGLEKIEMVTSIILDKTVTPEVLIQMLKNELAASLTKWKKDNNIS